MSNQDQHDGATSRRGFLQCMAWAGSGVAWTPVPEASPHPAWSASAQASQDERPQLRPDQRQPHRLQEAGQSRPARHAARDHHPDQSNARPAEFRPAHRRRHPPGDAGAVRHRPIGLFRDRPADPLRPRGARHRRRGQSAALPRPLRRTGRQGRRLVQLRRRRRPLHRPGECGPPGRPGHGNPRKRRPDRTAEGTMRPTFQPPRRSSSSPISRSGRSIPNGAGARPTATGRGSRC